jgi:hypothetical protein
MNILDCDQYNFVFGQAPEENSKFPSSISDYYENYYPEESKRYDKYLAEVSAKFKLEGKTQVEAKDFAWKTFESIYI